MNNITIYYSSFLLIEIYKGKEIIIKMKKIFYLNKKINTTG
jgi:hypothetical protein